MSFYLQPVRMMINLLQGTRKSQTERQHMCTRTQYADIFSQSTRIAATKRNRDMEIRKWLHQSHSSVIMAEEYTDQWTAATPKTSDTYAGYISLKEAGMRMNIGDRLKWTDKNDWLIDCKRITDATVVTLKQNKCDTRSLFVVNFLFSMSWAKRTIKQSMPYPATCNIICLWNHRASDTLVNRMCCLKVFAVN